MSDTPRTDAVIFAPAGNYFSASAADYRELSRTLERELATLTAERDALLVERTKVAGRNMYDHEALVSSRENLKDAVVALTAERDEFETALRKINVIRDSIIAHQSCNFSEHVYPLVAALNKAGVEGMNYPEALAYFGPVTERAAKAERELAAITAERDDEIEKSLDLSMQCERLTDERDAAMSDMRANLAVLDRVKSERDALKADLRVAIDERNDTHKRAVAYSLKIRALGTERDRLEKICRNFERCVAEGLTKDEAARLRDERDALKEELKTLKGE